MKLKHNILSLLCLTLFFYSCASTSKIEKNNPDEITLLFAGDVMAHSPNYNMKDYDLIWSDVKDIINQADLAFANIEAPLDSTKPASNYPYFNMPVSYVQSCIDAGFDVFSLCNNHTNDQELSGIKETIKSSEKLTKEAKKNKKDVYFAGLRNSPKDSYSYHLIEYNNWKILFLPMTELLNRGIASDYINFVNSSSTKRNEFIQYCKNLREKNPCDLFILSWHANETEYIRSVTESQETFYQDLLNAGVDIIWANHAHIIKNRKIIIDSETQKPKIIMYANGNTISAQRTKPDFTAKNPIEERDNTGDGLFYKVTLLKNKDSFSIKKIEPIFITTYITTANEYVIKVMDEDFINYLISNNRNNWANYIRKRIKINKEYTKDIIEWQ